MHNPLLLHAPLISIKFRYDQDQLCTRIYVSILQGNLISTPPTNGTILPGITRKTVIDISRDHDYEVVEHTVPVEELLNADEVFCTGTAVGVSHVGSITYQEKRVEYKTDGDLVGHNLYKTLAGLQSGSIEDKKGWLVEIE